jgi:hypothetical protein
VEYGELADEKVLSPAALRIVRRHRPDADDPRHCRGCGKPVGACDVVALAVVVSADPRLREVVAEAAQPARRTAPDRREHHPRRREAPGRVERRAGIERRAPGVAPA